MQSVAVMLVVDREREIRTFVPEDLHEAFDRACDREFFTWEGAASLYQVEG